VGVLAFIQGLSIPAYSQAAQGNVEIARICLSSSTYLNLFSTYALNVATGQRNGFEQEYEELGEKHYDDWRLFQIVAGPEARMVIEEHFDIGSEFSYFRDLFSCIGGANCDADLALSMNSASQALQNACRVDYLGEKYAP
jgi:hypothetical protein